MSPLHTAQDLARRQIALLGKMLLYSIDHLTDEDHEVYDSLVEELAARADSKKEIHLPPPPASPGSAPAPKPIPKPVPDQRPKTDPHDLNHIPQNRKLQGLKPESVVRIFIECWDKQDFKQEYYCLSLRSTQGQRAQMSLEDYVNSRYERFANRHMTGPISKQVVDISAPVIDGDMAAVQVAERHIGKEEDVILYRTYDLVFENTAWRILDFKTNQKRARKRV